MESIDTESIDISSLKERMLRPEQPSQQGCSRSATTLQLVEASEPQVSISNSNAVHGRKQPSLMHESESVLPSTVPESLDAANNADPQRDGASRTVMATNNMNTPGVAEATQEISQEGFQTFWRLHTSRIEHDRDETQYTLREGEAGYADLTSSYIPGGEAHAIDEPESVPVAYSPSQQTDKQITQYPESQRFVKTPATVGHNRDRNGHTKESPTLPQKPVLRSGGRESPSNHMAMTQLFGATQAATSPFVQDTDNVRSDRPSPAIELERRPATATSSSPLRPLPSSEFRRAATEPASHYKSMKYSQAARERKQHEELLAHTSDDSSSDDSFTAPRRHRSGRNQWHREAKTLESPTSSNPVHKTPCRTQRIARSSLTSPPGRDRDSVEPSDITTHTSGPGYPLASPTGDSNDREDGSEAETDQENAVAVIERGSQRMYDPEDKENVKDHNIQIPQTTIRPFRRSNQASAEVEGSPSVRPDRYYTLPSSTGPIAVANSQPSQPLPGSQRQQQPKSSSISGPEFVPQSQAAIGQPLCISNHSRQNHDSSKPHVPSPPDSQDDGEHIEKEDDEELNHHPSLHVNPATAADDGEAGSRQRGLTNQRGSPKHTSSSMLHNDCDLEEGFRNPSTVADTDFSRLGRQQSRVSSTADAPEPQSGQSTPFETAETGLRPALTDQLESSPPIRTPGPKRKRMSQIANQKTPSQPGWSQSFDVAEALDTGNDLGDLIQEESPVRHQKRRRLNGLGLGIAETATATVMKQRPVGSPASSHADTDELLHSQPAVRSTRSRQQLRKRSKLEPSKLLEQRKETWDVEVTPSPQSAAEPNRSTSPAQQPPTKKATRATRKQGNDVGLKHQSPGPECGRANQTQTPKTTPPKNSSRERKPSMDTTAPTHGTPSDTLRTAPTGETVAPNVVFACFNGKTRAYYPARCLGQSNDGQRFTIHWEGYDPDEVDEHGVRRLELRVGDQVKVDMPGVPRVSNVIRGFRNQLSGPDLSRNLTDQQGFSTLLVAPKQRKTLAAEVSTENDREVPVASIYLDSNMWNQFKHRSFSYSTPVEASDPTGYATPADQSSTPSSPSSRNRRQTFILNMALTPGLNTGVFTGHILAVSYDNDARRRELLQLMKENGATIVNESFAELFDPDMTTLRSNFAASSFTALVADKHSRKPKYLQALALGLPCLSGKWIESCVEKKAMVDWQKYLLPAGECDQLEGAIRSRVLVPADAAQMKLHQQLDQRIRVLNGYRVLVVMGRGKAEVRMNNYLFFVYAMGATSIETASDIRSAKALLDANQQYDFVYVEERDLESGRVVLQTDMDKKSRKSVGSRKWKVLGTESLVQSLILGEMAE